MINIGSGRSVFLKDIAKLILNKYKKKGIFIDNKIRTYLIANTQKLKKNTRLKFNTDIKKMIF